MTAPHFQATPGEVAVSQLGTLNKKSLALSAWNEKTAADFVPEPREALRRGLRNARILRRHKPFNADARQRGQRAEREVSQTFP
jgi:hypothetical protein